MPARKTKWADGERLGAIRSRAYVFVAISVLALAIFLYTNNMIRRLEHQTDTLSRSIAGLCASATYAARENEELRAIFSDLIERINFPIVISDVRGVPITWRGLPLEIDPYEVTHQEYLDASPENPPDTSLGGVMIFTRELDRLHTPIPMTHPGSETVMGYIHYGESSLVREMRYMPALELVAFGVLAALGFLGFRNAKVAELRSIWVGMAKETAHQLGTPISSLMGWIELIREMAIEGCDVGEITRMTREMQRDLERLEKISLRFNQIGSVPKTRRQDLVIVLREAIDYLRRRLAALGKDVEVRERYAELPPVEINRELMEWVIENLVKNSAEALPQRGGLIEISTEYAAKEGAVKIFFTDNGKGLSPAERRRIFAPGYSTKRKGWGLGLALARRIIDEYHKGRLYVSWSETGKGTTFVVSLPVS